MDYVGLSFNLDSSAEDNRVTCKTKEKLIRVMLVDGGWLVLSQGNENTRADGAANA